MAERSNWFVMRVSEHERAQFTELAKREGVPAAEAVRIAVRRALQDQTERPATKAEALAINRP